jgi:hypothetical protein
MARARPDRTGWLGPIRVVLIFALVGDLIYVPLGAISNGSVVVANVFVADLVQPDAWAHRIHPELSPGWAPVSLTGTGPGPHYTLAEKLLYLTGHGLAFALASIVMIIMALRLVGQAMESDPFTRVMVRRLRVLGAVVLVGGLLSEVAEYVADYALLRIAVPPDLRHLALSTYHPGFWWLLPGLILLAVAEIVRRGYLLRAELDTVI